MTQQLFFYTVEYKLTARSKWKSSSFNTYRHDQKDLAISIGRDLDEHGNCVRVREHGHADGMSRTVFISMGVRG